MMMMKIIAEVCIDLSSDSLKFGQFSRFMAMAMINNASTPTPAASVGVKMPP